MNRYKGSLLLASLPLALFLFVAVTSSSALAGTEPGRTDGPEGSEYGKGGYRFLTTYGKYYLEGYFGAAVIDIEPDNVPHTSTTELMGGFGVGYLVEERLAVQLGYGHISGDLSADLYSIGMRQSVNRRPFNYLIGLDAEIYSPDKGSSEFGIAPAVGAELIMNDHLRLGLQFQHDFIFSDDNISINRFSARLQYNF